jgi:hypothetical protein
MKYTYIALTAGLAVVAGPAFASVINIGSGKTDFIANQQMTYPTSKVATITTVETTRYEVVEPAAGAETMPQGNSMMPVNSTAKPSMPNAAPDSNPLPASD